jgi:hypothetical protein
VSLENLVDASLQYDAVVASVHANLGDLVPARLATARDAVIHHVVRHQEKGLQPLDAPAYAHREEGLVLARRAVAQRANAWRRVSGSLCISAERRCGAPSSTASPRFSLPSGTLYSIISRSHATASFV